MTDQPQRQWNGQQWFTWDGTQWIADPVYAPPPGVAPPAPAAVAPQAVVVQKKGHGCLIAFLIGLVVFAVVIAIIIAIGIGVARTGKAIEKAGVSTALGTKDATGDVALAKTVTFDDAGIAHVIMTVTNHSSKPSNYLIDVAVNSADGKTQLDTATALVSNLDPGQRSVQDLVFSSLTKAQAKTALVTLKSVFRTASP
jgi:hypothetical protein